MSRLRFTLAQLMAVVLLIGFGFAALRNANGLWASATFSLAILTVSVAVAGACSRQGRARTPWAGFAVAGGLTLVFWLSTSSTIGYVERAAVSDALQTAVVYQSGGFGRGAVHHLYASLAFARCGYSRLPRGDHGSSLCRDGRTAESLIVAVSSQTGEYALPPRQSPAVKLHQLLRLSTEDN